MHRLTTVHHPRPKNSSLRTLEPRRAAWRLVCCIVLLLALASVPGVAQSSEVHELHLYPGVERAPLRLSGWLVPSGVTYQVIVTAAPSFGTLIGEEYQPHAEFWQAGADRLSFQIKTSGLFPPQVTHHTLLLSPLKLTQQTIQSITDFEPGAGWPGAWLPSGPSGQVGLTTVNPLGGSRSLAASINGTSTAWFSLQQILGGGATGYGGSGGTVVDPPMNFETGRVAVVALGDITLEVETWDPPGPGSTAYRVRAVAPSGQCGVCSTPWRSLAFGTPVQFTLWAGSKVIDAAHLPLSGPWGVQFIVQQQGQPAYVDWIEGDFDVYNLGLDTGDLRLGIVEPPSGLTDLRVVFDDWFTWSEQHTFENLGHSAQDFEGGAGTAWPTVGSAGSITSAALGGNWSWSVDADVLIDSGSVEDTVVIDPSPGELAPGNAILPDRDTAVTALLRIDVSDLTLDNGDSIQIVRGSSLETLDGGLHMSLLLFRLNDQYRLQFRARDDHHVTRKSPWYYMTGDQHDVALQWRASSGPGADDGEIRFWVDGLLRGEVLGLDNDSKRLEALAFGAHRSVLNSSQPLGSIVFDDLATFPGQ